MSLFSAVYVLFILEENNIFEGKNQYWRKIYCMGCKFRRT